MKKIYSILLCIGLVASFVACEKDKDFALTTLSVANETITPWYESAQVSCSFKADATISEACVQYALSSSFVEYQTAEMAEEKGVYSAQLTDLQSDTMYYVRYVVSNKYSQVVSEAVVDFRTLQPVVPIVVLDTVSEVWDHRAIAQMRLVFNGGAAVTDMGICWGAQPQPTMKDIHRSTDDTLALIDITSLQPNTKYYARAYAVNKVGVAYSEEKEFVTLTQPEVRTDEVRDIELTSAVLVGKLLFNGNDTATIKGFCWGEKAVPTVDDDQVAIDTLTDEYSYLLSNLKDETQYFVRAYAKNKIGVVYGEERVFTTQAAVAPKVVTKEVKDVDDQSATVQGEVTSDGGAEVTERGVVYGTSENPTVENSKVTSGAGIGAFTCNLTGLQPNTKYYVRAYAVNKKGTAYGEQVSFTTLTPIVVPTVMTHVITQIAETTAVAGGNVTSDGGASVTERGVVYGISENPTVGNSKVVGGNGTGMFTCNLTDLQPNTKYYVRAYAVNSKGTAYGEQVSFTTLEEVKTTAEYVDLGLSVKWATVNVGATKPEEYGDYFAWGETEPKSTYNWSTYKWCNGSETTLTKYCTDGSYGTVDNKTQLELSDDASHVNWGSDWRIPTDAELNELVNECTWTWIAQNGVKGYKVIGSNGNSIFLPAAGFRSNSDELTSSETGNNGVYASRTLVSFGPSYSLYLFFDNENKGWSTMYRYVGYTIRPVYGAMPENSLASVTSSAVTQITETTAVAGGKVTADGGSIVLECGVVYSTSQNPTTDDKKITSDDGSGDYTCNLTGLQPNTKYYVRAYAVNSKGTAYGEQVSFTTLEEVSATPEYVDLGLSVKWATFNVGANKPEEYGDYFAWGETQPKSTYDWTTYKYCNGSGFSLTKYNNSSNYGNVDNKTQLELSDDAARANWGGSWRMPTDAELTELREQCTWTWTTQNGVNGYKVTSKSNGNSIFLPAAGYRSGSSLYIAGSDGDYWSSSLVTDDPLRAWYVSFDSDYVERSDYRYRSFGFSVRPVYGEYIPASTMPTVTTSAVTQITETTAVAGGNVTADGGASVTERGVVYGTAENPTTASGKVVNGSGTGSFTCNLTDLQPNTKYYVRAYAVNSKGTAYGEQVSFTTLEEVSATPEYVDLGLSVKWATFNVGATKPEEYGDYFAWGETEPKEVYDLSTYVWYNDSEYTLTKYNNSSDQGTVDNKTQLELSDDAAHVNWGGDWRMPTDTEFTELRENCTWTWTTQNGVNGYKVTSKSNGNSIFLPAAGYRYGSSLDGAGSYGVYWSSSLSPVSSSYASSLYFRSSSVDWYERERCCGQSVRPVYGEYVPAINLPVITTDVVTQITETTAVAGGNVTADGGASVTERGVVYGTSENPTVENSKVVGGSGTGTFTCNLTDLQPNTKYYVRAYAVNSQGTAYGEQVSFTTLTPSNGMENGYEWVDLGLSVKWATVNVGATKPEEYGDYFAWGETEPKEVYDWSTYKWCNGSYDTQTKYCIADSVGTVDNKTQLELSDDAAHVNLGGSWRMPTDAELTELRKNCTWTWTTQNGVNGYKVTSKSNGNSIFLPAAGYRYDSSLRSAGSYGLYWSSSLSMDYPYAAYGLVFGSGYVDWNNDSRYCGYSVRPVCQ